MHFATLPPEINSGRMYTGPGSESMISAATAWDGLAARLYEMAADYSSVTSKVAQPWRRPAAMAMAQAAAPHIEWLNTVGTQAEQAATRARSVARAYESALAAMVSPAVIDANRAQRMSLVSTNCLGQTGPAIADTDAEYEQMWAQDTDALYAYAGAAADASAVTAFTPPPATAGPAGQDAAGIRTSWALTAAPDVISAGSQVMSAIPEALQALSFSPLTTFDASLSPVTSSLSKLSSLSAPSGFAISHLNSLNKAAALRSLFPKPGRAGGAVITAGLGRGTSIGTLSVPRAWTTATTPSPVTGELNRGWVCEPIRLIEVSEPPL
ncbi:MAG: PPE family protein [Mycobacterium sp.]